MAKRTFHDALPTTDAWKEFDWLVRSLITAPGRDPAETLVDITVGVKPEGIFDRFILEHEHIQTALRAIKSRINWRSNHGAGIAGPAADSRRGVRPNERRQSMKM
jgi:hypothetical protein